MPKYKLRHKFFDGQLLHYPGDVVEIEEGKVPSSSILVEGTEPEPEPEPVNEPELDLTPSVLDAKAGDTLSGLSKKK